MQDRDIQTLTLSRPGYPRLLREIHDPPPVLYVKGTLLPEDEAAVAIVGTRAATPYGLDVAERLAEELARCGITVVSGLAEGIDRAAHEGALKAGGRTIAVVGHGLDTIYPRQHRELAERIMQSGCVLSEFSIGMPPLKENFPQRNRIISGLSLGTLVVEAPVRSGALITARTAMEQGREVFAVPGPVSSPKSEGTHALIKDGAKLVCKVQDILEELAPQLQHIVRASTGLPAACLPDRQGQAGSARSVVPAGHPEPCLPAGRLVEGDRQGLTREEAEIFRAVPVGASAGLEAIARATALQPARIMSALTVLELKGLVQQTSGLGFSRAN